MPIVKVPFVGFAWWACLWLYIGELLDWLGQPCNMQWKQCGWRHWWGSLSLLCTDRRRCRWSWPVLWQCEILQCCNPRYLWIFVTVYQIRGLGTSEIFALMLNTPYVQVAIFIESLEFEIVTEEACKLLCWWRQRGLYLIPNGLPIANFLSCRSRG